MPSLSESAPWGLLHPPRGRVGPPRIRTRLSLLSPFTTEQTLGFGGVILETNGGELLEGWSLPSLDAPKCSPVQGTVTAPCTPAENSVRSPHLELRPETGTDSSRILLSLFSCVLTFLASFYTSDSLSG